MTQPAASDDDDVDGFTAEDEELMVLRDLSEHDAGQFYDNEIRRGDDDE